VSSDVTDTLLFALLLAVVGGAVSVAYDYNVAAFGTVLMLFGLVVGTHAYVFPDADSTGESGSGHGEDTERTGE
jgi:hypothetical protein